VSRGGTGAHAALAALQAEVIDCRRCPRLVAWREQVAAERRAAFREEEYWGRPMQGFGDPDARVLVLGLAPAAHGGNRTGRIFTGDRSGDFLFAGLHRAGYANQPESTHRDDGLWITAAVRCAPPANKPTPAERDTCATWLHAELALLERVRVVLCLGGFAWEAWLRQCDAVPTPKPKFGHGAVWAPERGPVTVGCFHPSQQNTFTGKLTPKMLDDVLALVRDLAGE
jgi:uracil-DNA glycosylase family 4